MIDALKFFFGLSILFIFCSFIAHLVIRRLPQAKILLDIQKKRIWLASFIASLFGAITPFCVCTTVPVFTALLEMGVNFSVAMSFLFSSPLLNISSLFLIFYLFGAKFAVYFLGSVFLFSTVGGVLVRYLKLDNYTKDNACFRESSKIECRPEQFKQAAFYALAFFKSLAAPLFIGALIAALIHNYVPVEVMEKLNQLPFLLLIPLVAFIGFPLYINIFALAPICFSLVSKGMHPAAVMTFMMSGAGISLPTIMVFSKILTRKLFWYYLGYTFLVYCLSGIIFKLI
jgi:uncharacterized membrane protein YraQ (UPF0718 family)